MCNKFTCPSCRNSLERVIGGYDCKACHSHWKLANLIQIIKESPDEKHRIINIVDSDGNRQIADVVIDFEFMDDHKEFLVYTEYIADENGEFTVYISRVDRSNSDSVLLCGVADDDWDRVEMVLIDLAYSDDVLEIC